MYTLNMCQCTGCTKFALSNFDEDGNILETPGYCFEHTQDKEHKIHAIKNYVVRHEKIIGLNASGLEIKNIDINNKKFYGCNFQHCTITNLHGDFLRARMCSFDFCTISDCSFFNSNIQFTSFTGSKLVHVLFTGSDLIHNNFNGITAYQSSLDDSDLYNSRFIKSVLVNTSVKNCNLKKSVFYDTMRQGVSFKLSNTREALIDRNKGGLMGDLDAQFTENSEEEL
ncbi:MAG: pentapeptide repeat-containing protein [Treponema sp.]|nr:pentapeptide repeat-containing protein [Treponema sp.]